MTKWYGVNFFMCPLSSVEFLSHAVASDSSVALVCVASSNQGDTYTLECEENQFEPKPSVTFRLGHMCE